MKLAVHPLAREEIDAVIGFYEARRQGLGLAFLDEVAEVIEHVERFPDAGERQRGLPSDIEVRRFPLSRFRYTLFVAQIGDQRELIAVAHGAREPGYWRERLG